MSDPPPEDPPPCDPRAQAEVSDGDVVPGQTITVSTPSLFDPGSAVTVNLVQIKRDATADELASGNANAEGGTSFSVTIPDVPTGIYFIYVYGTGPDGSPVIAMAPIVIRNSATAQASDVEAASLQAAAPVPAQVAEVQTDLAPDVEADIVKAVSAGEAGLVISPEGTLDVRTASGVQQASALPSTGGDDISTQVTIGAALILAGTGLVLLRRRGGFTK